MSIQIPPARVDEPDDVDRHIQACRDFGRIVGQVQDRWTRPSPCEQWDARGVLEHVIGFHDVLLLRPLGAKPDRPRDDTVERWRVSEDAIARVLVQHPGYVADLPGGRQLDLATLVPMLTTEVLVHTWDLARAAELDVRLDPELCDAALARLGSNTDLSATGMYRPPVAFAPDAEPEERLVALLGRDPRWSPS